MKKFYLLTGLLILNTLNLFAGTDNNFTWANDKIRYTVSNDKKKIQITSIYHLTEGKEFISENNTPVRVHHKQ